MMPSDQRQTSRGYLHGVLLDGAKPFRYRGRVRSLLGMPDREGGNLAFSPTLPPVGFRYEFRGEPYLPPQHPPREVIRSALGSEPQVGFGSQDVTQENIQPNANRSPDAPAGFGNPAESGGFGNPPRAFRELLNVPIERASIEILSASETIPDHAAEKGTGQNKVLIKEPARQRGVRAGPRQEEAAVEPTEKSEKPGTGVERASIEMPSASETIQNHVAEKKTNQNKVLIKDSARQRGLRAEPRQEEAAVEPTEKSERPGTDVERASIEIPGVSEREQFFPALSPAKQGDTPPHQTEGRPQPEVAPVGSREDVVRTSQSEAQETQLAQGGLRREPVLSLSKGSAERSVPRPPVADGSTEAAPPPPSRLETPVPGEVSIVVADTVSRSNREAADRIEQLRHAVHQLTAKVSSQQARTNDETQPHQAEQTPPPPVQPVVIIKQSLTQARTPCAFWERSYLGRFRLRTLR